MTNNLITYRILLINLGEKIYQKFTKIFAEHSYIIEHTPDLKTAIELLKNKKNHGVSYCLVFLDLFVANIKKKITSVITDLWQIDPELQIICSNCVKNRWPKINLVNLEVSNNLLAIKNPYASLELRQLVYVLTNKWLLMQERKNYDTYLKSYLRQNTKQLIYQANHDVLTQLLNRKSLPNIIENIIQTSNNKIFALMYLDLDQFKNINDTFGHQNGDLILKTIATTMRHKIRKIDYLFRMGGDEFLIIFTNIDLEKHIFSIANNFFIQTRKAMKIDHQKIEIYYSMGISLYPKHGTTLKELLNTADIAMYKAKKLGGNQFVIYSNG